MRSRLEVVASARAGHTVIERVSGGGHFAARRTGPGEVHLVGTAAGPLGGDEATIVLRVLAGARLSVRSAGATIVQPGLTDPLSRLDLRIEVGEGAVLEVATEPTVVCAGAQHRARTTADLAPTARLRLVEHVVLGRSGEAPGNWAGRLSVARDGDPVVRHTVRSRLLPGVRVVSTLLDTSADGAGTSVAATHGAAVAMPLAAGGLLVTATGTGLLPTRADLAAAERTARPVQHAEVAGSA